MYEKVYQILENKIKSGLLPNGSQLPSRANLCKELHVSEKTVRRAVELLADAGLVKTVQRQRPTVTFEHVTVHEDEPLSLKKANATMANDILKTGILLCYPIISYGISLCSGKDWIIPETIIREMDPACAKRFWQLSKQFWRFFVARSGNDLILRSVDSLGLVKLDPLPGTIELRLKYYNTLKNFLYTVKNGGDPESIHFDDFSVLYRFISKNKKLPLCRVESDSPFRLGVSEIDRKLRGAEQRYSNVYLDILGLIAIGRYKPGERLPSHSELQKNYGVSVDTTMKAIQLLKSWGVVETKRGKGIFVTMNLDTMSRIQIDSNLISCHIRRYLDNLQLLSLTIEGVAAHAAVDVTQIQAYELRDKIEKLWNDSYLYQLSPVVLLEFLVMHIRYDALQAIYKVILKNYHLGRSIPNLIRHKKNEHNQNIYKQCIEAVDQLIEGNLGRFTEKVTKMFQMVHRLVIIECKQLHYWDAAMEVYDGTDFWK